MSTLGWISLKILNTQVPINSLGWQKEPLTPLMRKSIFTLLRYKQIPQRRQMPLIMIVSLKIYPHLPYCFQTNNEGQVTAQLKQENTVCTPGGKHRYQTHCTIILISCSQEICPGVAHGGAGADKAEYTTEEGRICS